MTSFIPITPETALALDRFEDRFLAGLLKNQRAEDLNLSEADLCGRLLNSIPDFVLRRALESLLAQPEGENVYEGWAWLKFEVCEMDESERNAHAALCQSQTAL